MSIAWCVCKERRKNRRSTGTVSYTHLDVYKRQHAGLVKLRTMDEELSEEDMKTVGELVNRVEEIVPELHREERKFDVSRLLDALSMGNGMER